MRLLSTLIIIVSLISCSDEEHNKSVPACLEDAKAEYVPNEIWLWLIDGESYYYLSSQCCDNFNPLYDSVCNYVCAPNGGFHGGGDGLCPEYHSNSDITKTLIWKDE